MQTHTFFAITTSYFLVDKLFITLSQSFSRIWWGRSSMHRCGAWTTSPYSRRPSGRKTRRLRRHPEEIVLSSRKILLVPQYFLTWQLYIDSIYCILIMIR